MIELTRATSAYVHKKVSFPFLMRNPISNINNTAPAGTGSFLLCAVLKCAQYLTLLFLILSLNSAFLYLPPCVCAAAAAEMSWASTCVCVCCRAGVAGRLSRRGVRRIAASKTSSLHSFSSQSKSILQQKADFDVSYSRIKK
jgi:hypothetical protein